MSIKNTPGPLRPVKQASKRVPGKLVRVDQLVMREGVRRELGVWEHWVKMMVWGWHDPLGRTLPLCSEGELLRMRNGLVSEAPLGGVVEDGDEDEE